MEYSERSVRIFDGRRLLVFEEGLNDGKPEIQMKGWDFLDILKVSVDQSSINLCSLSFLISPGYSIHIENDYFHRYVHFFKVIL